MRCLAEVDITKSDGESNTKSDSVSNVRSDGEPAVDVWRPKRLVRTNVLLPYHLRKKQNFIFRDYVKFNNLKTSI